jgi:predicted kinase
MTLQINSVGESKDKLQTYYIIENDYCLSKYVSKYVDINIIKMNVERKTYLLRRDYINYTTLYLTIIFNDNICDIMTCILTKYTNDDSDITFHNLSNYQQSHTTMTLQINSVGESKDKLQTYYIIENDYCLSKYVSKYVDIDIIKMNVERKTYLLRRDYINYTTLYLTIIFNDNICETMTCILTKYTNDDSDITFHNLLNYQQSHQ